MKRYLSALSRKVNLDTSNLYLNGYRVSHPSYPRSARQRNRLAAILRYAKAIPPKPARFHPETGQLVPHVYQTCHACGRQFFYPPKTPNYQANPRRKYCHVTCQNSRPLRFDRWLESKIMKLLKNTHRVYRKNQKIQFRVISTDSIEKYILQHRGRAFRADLPSHFTERIRQAVRRLVGIPGRSGERWQVIAFERNTNPEAEGHQKWIRIPYAPDRGRILVGLIRREPGFALTQEATSVEKQWTDRKINGRRLQDRPEWKGRFWMDEAGKVRPASDTRRPRFSVLGHSSDPKWVNEQSILAKLPYMKKGAGWASLLGRNKDIVKSLTAQLNKDFGL